MSARASPISHRPATMIGRVVPLSLLFLLWCFIFGVTTAMDDGHQFVQEVLSDDAEHYYEYSEQQDDIPSAAADHFAQQEQERLEREAEQRERAFAAKVAAMRDADARKAALRKKKHDARIVRRVLQAQAAHNLYGVLGLVHRYIQLPKRVLTIIPQYLTIELPAVNVGWYASDQRIKQAFRQRAKQTHPDKNSDGRAVQAFWAVDQAAEVLLDPHQRQAYDSDVQLRRQQERQRVLSVVQQGWDQVFGLGKRGVGILRTVLGPFFVPVSMLFVLIF